MKKHTTLREKRQGARALLVGFLINAATLALLGLIFTLIAYTTDDPLSLAGIFSVLSLLLCAAISGFTVSKRSESAYAAPLSSVAFGLMLLGACALISDGKVGVGSFINLIIYIALAALFGKLGKGSGARARRRRR